MAVVEPDPTEATHRVRVLGVSDEISVGGGTDARIAQIADRQRGRISSIQLRAAGISRDAVYWRVRTRRMFPLHHRVYAVGHAAAIALGAETAALLACGDDAVLGGLSAAALWGLVRADAAPGTIEVLTPSQHTRTLPGAIVRRTRILLPRDVRVHQGLPLTSPARTLLDLAEQLTERGAELAYDRGLVDRLCTRGDVIDVACRAGGRHGAAILRGLTGTNRQETVTRSEAEERMLALIRAAQLPLPRVNARLHGYEVDFHWPEHRLVVEVDGFRFHSSRRAFEHDRRKDAALTAAGFTVIRVTWLALTREPFAVIARLTAALTQRGAG